MKKLLFIILFITSFILMVALHARADSYQFTDYTGAQMAALFDTVDAMSANGASLTAAANYAAMRALLDLEPATDFYSIAAANAAFLEATQLDDTKGNGDTTYFWSADKNYDQLALKAPLASPTFTGTVVLPNSQALVTPVLGTPTSGTLTNCTGLPSAGIVDDTIVNADINSAAAIAQSKLATLIGADEEWIGGTGWAGLDGDSGLLTKNNLRDWGVLFDADGDGSLIDETWYLAITANQEVQDDVHFSFGNDDDASFAWDAAAVRLEIRDVSDNPMFWFDLANSSFNVASTASPKSGLYDSGATGTDRSDEYAGGIGANITDGTEDAVVSDVFIYYMDTTEKAALTVDGSADEISTALQFVTTGDIMGGINVSSKAGAYTIGTDDAHEAYGTLFINSNVADLTLPATPAVGMNGCLMQAAGVTGIMKLQPEGDENLVYQGVEMTAGTDLASAGAATDRICWVAITTDHWLITSSVGTWAE